MKRNLCVAESIGTFSLVFAGCGAIVVNDLFPGTLGHLGICIVFGLVVMAMIYSVGNISAKRSVKHSPISSVTTAACGSTLP